MTVIAVQLDPQRQPVQERKEELHWKTQANGIALRRVSGIQAPVWWKAR